MKKPAMGLICAAWAVAVSGALSAADPAAATAAQPAALVKCIKVLPDKAPDCSSLKSIAESVTRGCKTNDERLIAIYNFMIISHYHRQYPPGGPSLLWFNNYGWSLCGGLAGLQSSLFKEMGWPGHNMAEAKYDGKWHWFDCFQKFYAWRPDPDAPGGRTIACQDDLAKDLKGLLTDSFLLDPARKVVYARNDRLEMAGDKLNWQAPAQLTCGDTLEGIVSAISKRKIDGENAGSWDPGTYSGDVCLRPGFALTNTWDALLPPEESWPLKDRQAVGHTCGNKDLRNDPANGPVFEPYFQRTRSYSNGTLLCAPDFSSEAVLQSFLATENVKYSGGALLPAEAGKPASVTALLESPYLIMKATGTAESADTVAVSTDGKSFAKADLKDFTSAVKNKWTAQVKIDFTTALKSLRLEAVVINNAGSLPFLSPGKNPVAVSVADPKALGENKLVVTCAYAPGYRSKSFEQLFDEGKYLFSQQSAKWADDPTVVQKTYSAKDLPATFDIDVSTPKDKYPVYPRMIFLRREVIAANAKPLPLPDKAQEPKPGPNDELKALPNPFLIGTQPPAGHVERPTTTKVVATLNASHVVSKSGEVAENHFLKWPPSNDEKQTWIMLVGGEIKDLPASKEIVKARLAVPVVRGKESVPTKVCVVALKAQFEAGKPYDFGNLGSVLGAVTVPKHEAKENCDPPKEFKADITGYVKQLARGEGRFMGLAIRVEQDRNVDDGYIIRIDMPKAAKLPLEVDVYGPLPGPAK